MILQSASGLGGSLLLSAEPRRFSPGGAPQTAAANTVDVGVIAGAPYYIEIPVKWNKGLVLYTHGYTPEGREAAAVHVAPTQGIS